MPLAVSRSSNEETRVATITETPTAENLAEFLRRIGDVSPERIRMKPPPGTATVKDVIAALEAPRKRICELIDGVLVEKVMGAKESIFAGKIHAFLELHYHEINVNPGLFLGEAGTLEMMPGLVRIPDLSFVSWERLGRDEWPDEPVPDLCPDLAVEVISKSNTKGEMTRKLRDYFEAGVVEVWYVYPDKQIIDIYSSPTKMRRIPKDGTLADSAVFPGFTLPLSKLFGSTRRHSKR
jgi:Uma2 family endonuclease